MSTATSRLFTRPQILRQSGRPRLEQFLAFFATDLAAARTPLPQPGLSDEEFLCHWWAVLLHSEGLPPRLGETLHALEEMASPEGQERLERALEEAGLGWPDEDPASRFDFALHAWMVAPELFTEQHRRMRLIRYCRFEIYGSRGGPVSAMASPSPDRLERLAGELDGWFARRRRGRRATRVECYVDGDELCFLVRHGDTFARTRAVKEQRTELLQYRPERDDVVVYSPAHDELRINARTMGERQLYRERFGLLLFGEREHFCEHRTFTLEPLRERGASALDVRGIPELRRVTLRELKIERETGQAEFTVAGSADLFQALPNGVEPMVAPARGKLSRAAFDFEFAGCSQVRTVELVPPNVLKLGRHCDARIVGRFFCCRGFRRSSGTRCSCAGGPAPTAAPNP